MVEKSIVYDYGKLLGRMRELGYTQEKLASVIHIGETTMNKSLTNKRRFQQDEMESICDALLIPKNLIDEYFFCRATLEI